MKRDNVLDFEFDFAKIPPLDNERMSSEKVTEDRSPNIIEHNTQLSMEKPSFPYNLTKTNTFVPGKSIFSLDEVEPLPPTEKPLFRPHIVKLSMYLIIVGALVVVILAVNISFCFCYGCKSRERRYMNRDTVPARQNHPSLNPAESHPLNPPTETRSSQAQTTSNLANDTFDVNLDNPYLGVEPT